MLIIPGNMNPGAGEPAQSSEDQVQAWQIVSRYLALLRKFFWIFILSSTVTTTVAYFYTENQPRLYSSSSKILFLSSQPNIFGKQIERVDLIDPGQVWQFQQFWNTQREILRSTKFAERVVKQGGFLDRPGFIPETRDGKPLSEEERVALGASRVLGATSLSLTKDSRVVVIDATGNDPEVIAALANSYAEAYISYTAELQTGGLNQMVTWFDGYVTTKREELDGAQRKLHTFKRNNNILSISYESRQSLTGENMSSINQQLNEVKSKLAREESLLSQLGEMKRRKEDMRVIAEIVSAAGLKGAIEREALLRERLAQLRGRGYLENHRDVLAASKELEAVEATITNEIDRLEQGIENRVGTYKRERTRLKRELDALKSEAFELDGLGVEYSQLRDSAENLKELYRTVLKRSEELDINSMYENKSVQLLERANAPRRPISPNLPLNLIAGFILGIALGVAFIIAIDTLDTTVRSQSDVSRYTSRPILGTLPSVDSSIIKNVANAEGGAPLDKLTHIAPKSSFAEGIKTLRTNLMFMSPDNPPKFLLVTSPGPSEGKTMMSINMAIAMAQSGLKTIVIDSDMRRPRIHKAFGGRNKKGISSILTGDMPLAEAVLETEVENLEVLTCGPIPPNPSELLHTTRFQRLLDELDERYDRVIFDSPPLGAVSDGLVLSHSVDAVLLILKFGQTRRETLRRAIEQLVTVGAPFMGCVLNDINASVGGYGYSYYYYRYNYDDRPDGSDDMKKPDLSDA